MSLSTKLCQAGLFGAVALAVAAAPAIAQDTSAAKKKTVTQQHKKTEKKSAPAMDRDTTSNYPTNQIPGNGY